jgi:Tol biopolymer transport system component
MVDSDIQILPMAWDPLGRSIVYWTNAVGTRSDQWLLPLTGARKPVALLSTSFNEGHPQISPDGKWMACRYRNEDPNSPAKVIILPVEGGTPTKSIDLPDTIASYSPGWFPDGKSLVVRDDRSGTTNLWSLPLDGGPMKQLTDFKPDYLFSFDWQLSGGGKLAAMSRGTITSDVILISDFR